jgi:D-3-phosphoglycerate dehydrogenase / 2-oxoglutarate reductase
LLESSQYVVLACPLTAQTRGLIGRKELALMPKNAVLINVARGPVIDESALINALQSKQIAGAALDVFDLQPVPADHPFWSMENVLITPHVAGISEDSMLAMGNGAVEAVAQILEGNVPKNCINPLATQAFKRRYGNRLTG